MTNRPLGPAEQRGPEELVVVHPTTSPPWCEKSKSRARREAAQMCASRQCSAAPAFQLEPKWLRISWSLPWAPEAKDRRRNLSSDLSASSPCKAPQSTAMIRQNRPEIYTLWPFRCARKYVIVTARPQRLLCRCKAPVAPATYCKAPAA